MNNSNSIRSLTSSSLAAALKAHSQAGLAELAHMPTAAASKKQLAFPLTCQYTGISCGTLMLPTIAGYLPLLSQWKQQQVLHPVFSLELTPLLQFSKNTWLRYCSFSNEEIENNALTSQQEQMLQVCALAILHQLSDVRQDVPWLPTFSKRFNFPALRISRLEQSIDLFGYLQTCWDKKKQYESSVNEMIEEEKGKIAERALLAIRDELAGKRPLSQKLLWRWFLANLPKRYAKDADAWMWDLFTAKDTAIFEFTMADIDLFEEIFLSECPTGSSISYTFLEVLRSKRALLENHFEAFDILPSVQLQQAAATGEIAAAEPKLADFASKLLFIIAHAKWKLTHGSSSKHRDIAIAKQQQVTVKASFMPDLDTGRSRDFVREALDSSELNDPDYMAPDSIAAAFAAAEEAAQEAAEADRSSGEYEE
jgi:hypothetical protein